MKKYGVFLSIVALSVLFNCSKDKSYEPLAINYQAKTSINGNTIIDDRISYNEIIGYDTLNYIFLIDSNSIKKIKKYFFPSGGLPFSVNVNGETIYTGKFFPAYSNSLPCGIIIDPYADGNKLYVSFDSSFCNNDNQLLDLRNDKRIIIILQKDKKLIKVDW